MPCPSLGLKKLMRRTGAGGSGRRPEAPHIGFLSDSTLPPLASQAFAFLAMVKLWPCSRSFPCSRDLHSCSCPCLTVVRPFTVDAFHRLALAGEGHAGAINVASAPAIATPFNVPFFIVSLLVLRGCCGCRRRRPRAAAAVRASSIGGDGLSPPRSATRGNAGRFPETAQPSSGAHVEFVSPPFVSSHGQAALLHDDDAADHVHSTGIPQLTVFVGVKSIMTG